MEQENHFIEKVSVQNVKKLSERIHELQDLADPIKQVVLSYIGEDTKKVVSDAGQAILTEMIQCVLYYQKWEQDVVDSDDEDDEISWETASDGEEDFIFMTDFEDTTADEEGQPQHKQYPQQELHKNRDEILTLLCIDMVWREQPIIMLLVDQVRGDLLTEINNLPSHSLSDSEKQTLQMLIMNMCKDLRSHKDKNSLGLSLLDQMTGILKAFHIYQVQKREAGEYIDSSIFKVKKTWQYLYSPEQQARKLMKIKEFKYVPGALNMLQKEISEQFKHELTQWCNNVLCIYKDLLITEDMFEKLAI